MGAVGPVRTRQAVGDRGGSRTPWGSSWPTPQRYRRTSSRRSRRSINAQICRPDIALTRGAGGAAGSKEHQTQAGNEETHHSTATARRWHRLHPARDVTILICRRARGAPAAHRSQSAAAYGWHAAPDHADERMPSGASRD
ncbi:hypothetical protein Pen02_82200 [Plantactinospora endophytica]|uniref:Uncharacterized protein n=1 Tax=Plantactinospora endophytica TaxID=673535 RepID=A0ABQ4EF02_9ACTN|nr:hypothetical protein Pen02_82200 [Plantactinospora endophytica]